MEKNKAIPRDSGEGAAAEAAGNAASGRDSSSASNEAIPNSDIEEEEREAKTEATLYAIPKRSHDRRTPDCPQCQRKSTQPEAASALRRLFHIWSSSARIAESRATSLLSVDENAVTPLRPRKKWGFRRKSSVGKQKSTQQPPPPPPTPPPSSSSGKHLPRPLPRPQRTSIKQRPLPCPQPCIEPTPKKQTPMYPTLIQQTSMSCSHPAPINKKTLVTCSRPTPAKQASLSSMQQTQKTRHATSPSDPQLVPTSFKKVSLPVERQKPQSQQMMQLLPLPSTLSSSQAPHWKPLLWPLPLPQPSAWTLPIAVPELPLHGGGNRRDDGSQTLSAKSLLVASDTQAPGSASNNNVEDCTTHWVCLPFGESHCAEADALLPPAAELTSIQSMTLEASQTHQGCSGNRSAGNPSSIRPQVHRVRQDGICGRQYGGCGDKYGNPAIGQCGGISGNRVGVKLSCRVPRGSVSAAAAMLGGGDICNCGNNSSSSSSSSSCRCDVGKVAGTVDAGDKVVDSSDGSSSNCSNSNSGSSSDSSCLHFGVNPHDFSVVGENPFRALRSG